MDNSLHLAQRSVTAAGREIVQPDRHIDLDTRVTGTLPVMRIIANLAILKTVHALGVRRALAIRREAPGGDTRPKLAPAARTAHAHYRTV